MVQQKNLHIQLGAITSLLMISWFPMPLDTRISFNIIGHGFTFTYPSLLNMINQDILINLFLLKCKFM